jgi:hypothetical protein
VGTTTTIQQPKKYPVALSQPVIPFYNIIPRASFMFSSFCTLVTAAIEIYE